MDTELNKVDEIEVIEEEINMAVLATNKPTNFVIDNERAKEFITMSNKKKISCKFLQDCKDAASLFKVQKRD